MYFKSHPKMVYNGKDVIDIFHRIVTVKYLEENYLYANLYDIKESETPEILANKLYGDGEFHWVILLVNNIINVKNDWPKNQEELNDHINSKYSSPYSTHHYEDADGDIVDVSDLSYTISNYDYEFKINVNKSKIKLVKPEYLNKFVKNFRALIK
jgi:hypothetical protein